ncbi:MAG TPA: HlyD family efflux transporter periplasmic adaptor subunit [Candidatus Angelobacter sp.]|jgi:multidrug resistance efflux pump|nr:HlyD family efflux transporter periplasmic adaptor subunit [Candidatus Angelobacter sp.]
MKKKILRFLVIALSVALLGMGIAYAVQQLRPAAKIIPTIRVQKGTLAVDVHTDGELHTPHSAMLVAPPVNGTLQIVHIAKTGSAVKAGDLVVEFDPSEQEYNLEQSRSQLAEAEQQITKAKADAEVKKAEDKVALLKAKFDVRRAELEVGRNELASEIDAKKNLLALEQARRHLEQIQQDISSRAASSNAALALLTEKSRTSALGMKQAQQNIDNMKLKSPIDGLVSVKDNQDAFGGWLAQGLTVPQYREGDLVYSGRFLAEVLDMKQMEVVAKVYESDRPNLTEGQSAEIHIDADPQGVYQAKVKSIAGMASRNDWGATSIQRFDVAFSLMSQGGPPHLGVSAEIIVRGTQLKDQLYLPSQCLFEKDGKPVVYVKQGDHFEATEPKIKLKTENRLVLENLPEGTEVALVDPEAQNKKQPKGASSSAMGVGQ